MSRIRATFAGKPTTTRGLGSAGQPQTPHGEPTRSQSSGQGPTARLPRWSGWRTPSVNGWYRGAAGLATATKVGIPAHGSKTLDLTLS